MTDRIDVSKNNVFQIYSQRSSFETDIEISSRSIAESHSRMSA